MFIVRSLKRNLSYSLYMACPVICMYIVLIGTKESCYLRSFIECFGQIATTFFLSCILATILNSQLGKLGKNAVYRVLAPITTVYM